MIPQPHKVEEGEGVAAEARDVQPPNLRRRSRCLTAHDRGGRPGVQAPHWHCLYGEAQGGVRWGLEWIQGGTAAGSLKGAGEMKTQVVT